MSLADTVIQNADIYTLDSKRSWAEALAIRANRIIYVGDLSAVKKFVGPDTEVLDLKGNMVLPGFIDSHTHVSGSPNPEAEADLNNLSSKAEILAAVKQFADTHPQHEVIYGSGWKNELFGPAGPIKEDLDAIISDRPVSLTSEDGHFAWVNSKAIELAGVSKASVNPPGGLIEKNPHTGEPSGTFRETARDLLQHVLAPFSVEQIKCCIRNYMQTAARVGITSVHDPLLVLPDARGQLNGFGGLRNNIQAFAEMAREHQLNIRVRGTVLTDPSAGVDQIKTIAAVCKQQGPQFQITGIKVFVDGVVEGGTAYLLEPYAHLPESRGLPLWDPNNLNDVITAADKAGLQVHLHVIGDAALRMSLDALEQAQMRNGKRDSRHLITHLHVVDRADIPRMARLNVIGVPQPFWHVKGDYFRDIEARYLGVARAERAYPMQSLAKAGILLASASDYPVEVPSPPLLGIQLGVTRCEPGVTDPQEILDPQERMPLTDMIASFTHNGAIANFLEQETGSIEAGKKADLVILEKNLFKIPETEIADVNVLMTLFEGKTVYRDGSI